MSPHALPISRRLWVFVIAMTLVPIAHAGVQFQPVSGEELKMTSEPLAPGAPAVILYREVYRDDCGITCHSTSAGIVNALRSEENYVRIKILTEAGRKYGDIEIPLWADVESIGNINARTIRPDGSIVNFSGQIFEKKVVKAKGFEYRAQTFAMPDVEVGSILEYYYTVSFARGYIVSSTWILSQELFTKKAKFTLRPFSSPGYPMTFRWNEHLPSGTPSPKQRADGVVELEAATIPAFQAEDFMPPVNELQSRVEFLYVLFESLEQDPGKFWKEVGKSRNHELELFLGKRSSMEQVVSQIVSPSDSQEAKLRKIYARVQQLHNTSYGVRRTEQEKQREDRKSEETVADVWKRGSGESRDLNWLFVALSRAAGIESYGVWASNRATYFFDPRTMQSGRLQRSMVLVRLNGNDLFLEPGTPFVPFGMLPWEDTGVYGLRLDKDGGAFVQIGIPESSASRVERKAEMKLSTDGSLSGSVQFTYTGIEAIRMRLGEINQDDTARNKFLEDDVKYSIPLGSEVELTTRPEWNSAEAPLKAVFQVKIPGWLTVAGTRGILPVGIFSGTEKHVFEYSDRVHPIYYEYKSQKIDDVTIKLPPEWQVSAVPKAQDHDVHVLGYASSAENNKGELHLTRKLEINAISIEPKYYAALRSFYQLVKSGDEQPVLLALGASAANNQ